MHLSTESFLNVFSGEHHYGYESADSDVFSGRVFGLNLSLQEKRKYNVYVLSGSGFNSHMSLVFQPYPHPSDGSQQSESEPYDYFHTAELTQRSTEESRRLGSGGLCFRNVNHLKDKFLDRQMNYTVENICPAQLSDLVNEIFEKSNFSLYESFHKECETFARTVDAVIVQAFQTTPNGQTADPFRKTGMARVREYLLEVVQKLLDLPIQALFVVFTVCFPFMRVVPAAFICFAWYKNCEAFSRMLYSHDFVSSQYSSRALKEAIKLLPYVKVLSLSLLVLQSVINIALWDSITFIQMLLVVCVWFSAIEWYEAFGLSFAEMQTNTSRLVIAEYATVPTGRKFWVFILKVIASTSSLDLSLCLVFMSGEYSPFPLMGFALVLLAILAREYQKFSQKASKPTQVSEFLKEESRYFVALILLVIMAFHQRTDWFLSGPWLHSLFLQVQIVCLLFYCTVAWRMHGLDCESALQIVFRKTSALFEKMSQEGLFSVEQSVFHEKLRRVLESAVFVHRSILPMLRKLSHFDRNASRAFVVFLPVSVALYFYYGHLWLLLLVIGVSTWIVATLDLVVIQLCSLITYWQRHISEHSGDNPIQCCMRKVGCPNPIYEQDQEIYVCTKCSDVDKKRFLTFCESCNKKGCNSEKYHPFYVLKVKANWSVLDLLLMVKRKFMVPGDK